MGAHVLDGRPAPALRARRSSDPGGPAGDGIQGPAGGTGDGADRQTDGGFDPNAALTNLLARSLDRQVKAAERTADRMDDLGGKIDKMGDRIAEEVRNGMSLQLRVVGGLVALAIILLAAVAGVQFSGGMNRDGSVRVDAAPAAPAAPPAAPPAEPARAPAREDGVTP